MGVSTVGRKALRILFVLTQAFDPNRGGVQMSTYKLSRWFAGQGYTVGVFSFAREGHLEQDFALLFTAGAEGGHIAQSDGRKLAKVLETFEPDVVVNQMPYEHFIGEILLQRKNYLLLGCLRNTLYSVRNNLADYGKRVLPSWVARAFHNPLGRAALLKLHRSRHGRDLSRILQTYDYFVMFGPPNLEELEYFVANFDRDKIRLIPNSIPMVPDMLPHKERRLLWLGRVVHEQKRADLILEVWKRVSAKLPDWYLDIVGNGPALADIRRAILEEGIARVEIHGRQVPDEYYRRAAIFFMTSSFEGFPNTLVEAQSFGAIPVIFDSYPVARWIVDSGQNGFLIRPFDVGAMAGRIIEIAKAEDRRRLAQQTLDSARRFEIGRVGAMWKELFESEVPRHRKQVRAVRG